MMSYIVMAAGSSLRFKSPKQLACIENDVCINFLLKKLIACPVREVVVVLGANQNAIIPYIFKHNLIRVVYNNDYIFGQTSSAIAGLKETHLESRAFALHPVDCPFLKQETIAQLLENFCPDKSDIHIPTYHFKKGHPLIFNKKVKELILKLDQKNGINTVFNMGINQMELIETNDPGVIQSFNTQEELDLILKDRREHTT